MAALGHRCTITLTPKYREYVNKAKASKQVYHLQSPKQVQSFYREVEQELEK